MIIGITGSRHMRNCSLVSRELDMLAPSHIVTGGASGADNLAERYARERGIPLTRHLPAHQIDPSIPYHPGHYHARNRKIINDCDMILAFMAPDSRGTKATLTMAKKAGKPCKIIHIS